MQREFRELSDQRPGLPPPQFSVRFMLFLTATIAALIVLARHAPPAITLAGVVGLLSVLAHLVSTAIGGQLRSGIPRSETNKQQVPQDERIRQPTRAHPSDFAPSTQLSRKRALDRRPILWFVGIGAGGCSIISAVIVSLALWPNISILNVLFGAASAAIIGGMLGADPVKAKLFSDYPYAIKSLGGWGGDYIMAFGDEKTPAYFKQKGFHTVIPFKEMKAT